MWNGTMFVDLDWPLNASSLLSASAELLVVLCLTKNLVQNVGFIKLYIGVDNDSELNYIQNLK